MNIIIAFTKTEITNKLNTVFLKCGYPVVVSCKTGLQVLAKAQQMETGIILSGIKLKDMTYHEIRDSLSDHFEMLVISSGGQWDELGDELTDHIGVPFKLYELIERVRCLEERIEKRLESHKNRPPKRSPKEQGIINEAKQFLMDEEGYTEEGAHRFIQKYSMDHGKTMVKTAELIVRYRITE